MGVESQILKLVNDDGPRAKEIKTVKNYYKNENDILLGKASQSTKQRVDKVYEELQNNPLRSADNRISHPFYQDLVDQKISYLLAKEITLQSKDKKALEEIKKVLGEDFKDTIQDAGIVTGKQIGRAHV